MKGRLHGSSRVCLVVLLLGWAGIQAAYANEDPISVGPKTFTSQQAQTQSQPETLRSDPSPALNARLIRLPEVSRATVKSKMTQDAGGPTKIGFARAVPELNTPQDTQSQLDWKPVPEGMVGSLAIQSPNAAAIRLGMRVQSLPDSAEFRFFTDQVQEVIKVSGRTINEMVRLNLKAGDPEETARVYWSPVMQGEVIGLEVFVPQGTSVDLVSITLPSLSHLTISPASQMEPFEPRAGSASCNLDVMCYPAWSSVSNSVGRMVYSSGGNSFLCTGTLLNDQGSTGTPYFLTANHCISTQSVASTLQTYWFYHSSACNSGVPYSGIQTIPVGSTILYSASSTDTSFLQLNSQPPVGVSYAGWTTSTPIIGTPSTGLHNPQGDFQKISLGSLAGFQSCIDTAQGFSCTPAPEATGSFLQMLYSQGMTEGGSSGSGVFTNNGQYLYGQLKGGNITCDNPYGSTTYGRFDKAYSQGNLGQWLSASDQPKETLAVDIQGVGRVTSTPAGIDCPTNCIASFQQGQDVTLTPKETNDRYVFAGWDGPCSHPGGDFRVCKVTMNGSRNVTAKFNEFFFLTLKPSKGGVIEPLNASTICGPSCFKIMKNRSVELIGYPEFDYLLSAWGSDCFSTIGTTTCTLLMDSDKTASATFTNIPDGRSSVTVLIRSGQGVIKSSPSGIDCGTTCNAAFLKDADIEYNAVPAAGYAFDYIVYSIPNSYIEQRCTKLPCIIKNQSKAYAQSLTVNFKPINTSLLNVASSPNGTIISTPAGISCGSACSASFNLGTNVTLIAQPDTNYTFTGWSGDCSGTGACTLNMTSNKNVSATFTYTPPPPAAFNLTVTKTGSGTVISQPAGIDCGATCNRSIGAGTSMTLVAQPDNGFAFSGWNGACSGTGTCAVVMDGDKSVSANFTEVPKYWVTMIKPTGGVVSSQPGGISCGGANRQCKGLFSSARLVATADPGHEFVRWAGCQTPEANVCVLQPTKKTSLQAVFRALPKFTLKVTKNSLGAITSVPGGLICPDKRKTCSVKFTKGTPVTLTPIPQTGRSFAGWTGACSGLDACTLVMDGGKGVGAMFQ